MTPADISAIMGKLDELKGEFKADIATLRDGKVDAADGDAVKRIGKNTGVLAGLALTVGLAAGAMFGINCNAEEAAPEAVEAADTDAGSSGEAPKHEHAPADVG